MRKSLFFLLILIFSCTSKPENSRESWIRDPVSDWPDFALTNEICFRDTTFSNLANGFLVNTGANTIAVSCKHIFMLFEKYLDLNSIDLGEDFISWKMYPKNKTDETVGLKRLINTDPNEPIGQFNSLKVRDWIIMEINEKNPEIYPLKIRHTPIKKSEIIYSVGWGMKQEDNSQPKIIKLQCIKSLHEYTFTKTITEGVLPHGRSGSPVIDKNGYLVGIVSGQEGSMGVMGNASYLRSLFDKYGIEYVTSYP